MYTKARTAAELKKDEIVNDIFVVKSKNPIQEYARGYMFELKIGDATKDLVYKYWGPDDVDKIKSLHDSIQKDEVIFVQGRVGEWNNRLEISSNENSPPKVLKKFEYDASGFIKKSGKDDDAIWAEVERYAESVNDDALGDLLEHFFNDEGFVKRFRAAPASMYIHHGWVGGVVEHTLAVTKICDLLCGLYPELDRDLLITGSLLHNIGKIHEFDVTTNIKPSKEGVLLGHTVKGIEMLTSAFERLKTDEELRIKLTHMMLTHTGEFGSNKKPAFPEAFALHYADHMDANIAHVINLKNQASPEADFVFRKDIGHLYMK